MNYKYINHPNYPDSIVKLFGIILKITIFEFDYVIIKFEFKKLKINK